MVTVRQLSVAYGGTLAVRDATFVVPKGEVMGLIGSNGAGKTTIMRAMATLVRPVSGWVMIAGITATSRPLDVRGIIGWVPDHLGVYPGLSARDYLDFFAGVNRLDPGKRRGVVRDLLALTDLEDKADAPVEGLSRGMRQRLSIARALLHDPELLLLDEPTEGLDPRARIEMRELLLELKAMGKTIVVSSHLLHELGQLCTRVCVMESGRMITEGRVEDVCRLAGLARQVEVEAVGADDALLAAARALPQVSSAERTGERLSLRLHDDEGVVEAVHEALVAAGARIRSFRPAPVDLESLFLRLTSGRTA
jgi:ABC-2 type transport system ATP-binding protein